jgi:hypothetical protein
MSTDAMREDLNFLRTLVEGGQDWQRPFGRVYFAAGLCYSVQMLMHGAQLLGVLPTAGWSAIVVGFGPTVVFLALLTILIRLNGPMIGSAVAKAVGSVFGAVGIGNLVIAAMIASVAWRERGLTTWLIFPCVVMALQGLAWLTAWQLRRRAWILVVAAGWFATSLAMAASIESLAGYVIAAGLGMFGFMLVPGAVMMRRPTVEA